MPTKYIISKHTKNDTKGDSPLLYYFATFALMRRVLLLLLILPSMLWAQDIISGVVADGRTHEPLPYATVYLNGTTQGTITDSEGRFELRNVSFPVKAVFSFVGYKTQIREISSNPGSLMIELQPADNLPEVTITDSNERQQYLEYFRSMFLGDDRWGRRAIIRNPDALLFDISADKTLFKAWANEPLMIDMPLLGYELYVNLIGFTIERIDGNAACDILGYFFYMPYRTDRKKYEKNRREVYYNSSRHFLKSYSTDRLAQNGYLLQPHPDDSSRTVIRYYHKLDGSPLDLTGRKPFLHPSSVSGMHRLSDGNIRFTGRMSQKRIGASLPDDFDVEESY